MKGIIDLADVQESPAAVTAFYDRFRGKLRILKQWSRGTIFFQICSSILKEE